MCLKIILKVTKNQSFTLSLEDKFFEKPKEVGEGGRGSNWPPAVLGLRQQKLQKKLSLSSDHSFRSKLKTLVLILIFNSNNSVIMWMSTSKFWITFFLILARLAIFLASFLQFFFVKRTRKKKKSFFYNKVW